MRKLQTLKAQLSKTSILSKNDLLHTIGGRRYETKSYGKVVALCQQLWQHGYQYSISQHNGKYCIEW